MPLLSTDAIVLHAFDYLESSRILRVATREAGVRSVLARGARRSARRFGTALDLFARGAAQLHTKPGRELDTLGAFEVTHANAGIALELERFTGASALAELTLRFARDAADPALFDAVVGAIESVAVAPPDRVRETVLAGAWRIVAEMGFAPATDSCAQCHRSLAVDEVTMFSHPAGGALCRVCSRLAVTGRVLPAEARVALHGWISGEPVPPLDDGEGRAHQRLLREFLREHLADDRPLRAMEIWERQALGATAASRSAALASTPHAPEGR